jgi:hypothetical protein
LKDAVIVVVQEVEPGQVQQALEDRVVAVDEVVVVFVALHVLVEEGLSQQTVDHARHVAAIFFGEASGVEEGVGVHKV